MDCEKDNNILDYESEFKISDNNYIKLDLSITHFPQNPFTCVEISISFDDRKLNICLDKVRNLRDLLGVKTLMLKVEGFNVLFKHEVITVMKNKFIYARVDLKSGGASSNIPTKISTKYEMR